MAEQKSELDQIWVSSIYGWNTRQPAVSLMIDGKDTQLSPAKAREVAQMLLQAAEAAISDAFLFAYVSKDVGVDDEQAAQLVIHYRKWRDRRRVDKPYDGEPAR
ncbi:MAG: hypothetical protein U0X20_23670 [Caldilineaceae bacterium]